MTAKERKNIYVKNMKNYAGKKSDMQIAKIILKEYPQISSSLDSLRKKICAVRNQLNIEPAAVEKHKSKFKVKNVDIEIDEKDWIKKDEKIERLSESKKETQAKLKFYKSEAERSQKQLEVALQLKDHKIKPIKINKAKSLKSEATAVAMYSDWHYEETVEAETVNNLNQYNLSIAKDRSSQCFQNTLRLIDIFQKDIKINNLVLGLLGDFMTGYIHDELIENNNLSPTQTVLILNDVLSSGIEYFIKNSKLKLKVVCKIGNHGRTTDKMRHATAYKNSYEWMLYHQIAKNFKRNDRVEFIIENGYHTYVDIYDYRLRFHHGDAIRYRGGVGGLHIPANRKISEWNNSRPVNYDVFGHFHQLMLDAGRITVNGSLIGMNAYGVSGGYRFEHPKQGFFLVDSKRGKTVTAPIIVE